MSHNGKSSAPDPAPSRLTGEHLALLALSTIRGVGYWTLFRMGRAGVSYADLFSADDGEVVSGRLRNFGARLESKGTKTWHSVRERALDRAGRMFEELLAAGIKILLPSSSDFPSSLTDLPDPPEWLFVQGDLSVLNQPSISAVGTRDPSEDGVWLGKFVGHCFAKWGAPTVSGLATGIDQLVHEMSLRARVPTIAVLGTGISAEYPKGAAPLRDQIIETGGAILTEYLPQEKYSAENFIRRNRLQAALGRVLIPIEWAPKGGTAHTVRYASAIQRPIACLRLPDWSDDRLQLNNGALKCAATFTLPGQEEEFRAFVAAALRAISASSRQRQLSLI